VRLAGLGLILISLLLGLIAGVSIAKVPRAPSQLNIRVAEVLAQFDRISARNADILWNQDLSRPLIAQYPVATETPASPTPALTPAPSPTRQLTVEPPQVPTQIPQPINTPKSTPVGTPTLTQGFTPTVAPHPQPETPETESPTPMPSSGNGNDVIPWLTLILTGLGALGAIIVPFVIHQLQRR
jgi:hypothetical protein